MVWGTVTEIDEWCRAMRPTNWVLDFWFTHTEQPVPRFVIDDFDPFAILEFGPDLIGVYSVKPNTEVDEDTPEIIALLVRFRCHIDALDST